MSVSKIIASIPEMSAIERDQTRSNAKRSLAKGTDDQKAEASEVIDALDQQAASEHKALYDRLNGMDRATRLIEAFRNQRPTETDEKVIRALLDNPGSTSPELTQACGWQDKAWQLHFGTMCKEREAYLWPSESFVRKDASFYSGILADFDDETARFTMKPDVTEAFATLGFTPMRTA